MRHPRVHRDGGALVAHIAQFTGFCLMVTGLALVSVPLAAFASGAALFFLGGLALRK